MVFILHLTHKKCKEQELPKIAAFSPNTSQNAFYLNHIWYIPPGSSPYNKSKKAGTGLTLPASKAAWLRVA